jgi:hypothetical protein
MFAEFTRKDRIMEKIIERRHDVGMLVTDDESGDSDEDSSNVVFA